MTESLESFVKKLQTEGIDAGRDAGEKIKNEAKREAEKILAEAKADADKIDAQAERDAKRRLSHAQNELELAVRDAVLKLGDSLGRILSVLLARRVEKKFSDPNYIGEIIREVIITYAKADAGRQSRIEINVPSEMRDKLIDGALEDLSKNLDGDQDKLALQATLSKAGFEYKIHGATVEVSPDSVSELLSEMVNPALQEIISDIVGKMDKKPSDETPGNEGNPKDQSHPEGSREREETAKGQKE